MLLPPVWS